jgi:antitoxin (DNA-binding transcriptional repressor) of toxin-antitoxin stability system
MKKNILNQKKPAPKLLSAAETPSYARPMTKSVDLGEAAANLPRLVAEATGGEEVFLSKDGNNVVQLVPVNQPAHATLDFNQEGDQWLGYAAKYLREFNWEEWEEAHEEFKKMFRDYEDFK